MHNRNDVRNAQAVACEGMLRELATLARKAEKRGGGPQGARLAKAADAIAKGKFIEAMKIRDEMKCAHDSVVKDRRIDLALWIGLVVVVAAYLIGGSSANSSIFT